MISELTKKILEAQALIDEAKKQTPKPKAPEPEAAQTPPEPPEEPTCEGIDPLQYRFGTPYTMTAKGVANGLNQRYWAERLRDQIFFESCGAQFYRFSGRIWAQASKAQMRGIIDEVIRDWQISRTEDSGEEMPCLANILADKKLEGVVNALESFTTRTRAFEAAPEGLILAANGRIEISKDGHHFRPCDGRQEDLQRNIFPADYDPEATTPKLTAWLDRMFKGRKEDMEAVQKLAGICLAGKNKYKKFVILEGSADMGKGVLLRLLGKIAGESCTEGLRTKYLEERFETKRFVGKTLLVAADVPETFMSLPGTGMVKTLVGGDRVPVEGKGTDESLWMTGHFALIVDSNFRQRLQSGTDREAWRTRLVYLIADGEPFKDSEKDNDLLNTLWREEASGILNWALEGLQKLTTAGVWEMSDRQKAVRDDIINESASITSFVCESLEACENGGTPTDALFGWYRSYCADRGWTGFPEHAFTRMVKDAIYTRFRVSGDNKIENNFGNRVRGYPGIEIKMSAFATA